MAQSRSRPAPARVLANISCASISTCWANGISSYGSPVRSASSSYCIANSTNAAAVSSVDLSSVIRPGDGLIWGQACAEPQTLVEALLAQRSALSGCSVFLGSSYSGLVRAEHADHLRFSSYCGTGTNRALADSGVLQILPSPYSQLGALIRARRIPSDVAMVQVSPPNARGEFSLGLAVEYLAPALEAARAIIGEVNDQVPWTHTQPLLRRQDFDLLI